MVIRESPWLYLLIGQDNVSKDIQLAKIKKDSLPKTLETFNLDILFAHDLNLKSLQEKLLSLPVKVKKRLVIIKEAQQLKEEIKKFLLGFCRKPPSKIILVLDINPKGGRDEFINTLSQCAQVYRFGEIDLPDTFGLWRQISSNRSANALKILNELLRNSEKPERILGGLRYACLKEAFKPPETRKRLKLLLNCDIDIKTGRLKPDFALEKLVVALCGFAKFPG